MKVFLSWSGERSKMLAEALRWLLRRTLQHVEPWLSEHEIQPGEVWSDRLRAELVVTDMAIICITNENAERPWIMYEAGAIGTRIEDSNRVVPYLLDFEKNQLKQPLGMYQAVTFVEAGTKHLFESINARLGDKAIPLDEFNDVWAKWHPDFQAKVASIPATPAEPPKEPDIGDRLDSIDKHLRRIVATGEHRTLASKEAIEREIIEMISRTVIALHECEECRLEGTRAELLYLQTMLNNLCISLNLSSPKEMWSRSAAGPAKAWAVVQPTISAT